MKDARKDHPGGSAAGKLEARKAARDNAAAFDDRHDEAEGGRRLGKIRGAEREVDGGRGGVCDRGQQRREFGVNRLQQRADREGGGRADDRVRIEVRAIAKFEPPRCGRWVRRVVRIGRRFRAASSAP